MSKSITFKNKKIETFKSNSSGLQILEEMCRIASDETLNSKEKSNALKKFLE